MTTSPHHEITKLTVIIPVTERRERLDELIQEYDGVLSGVVGSLDFIVILDGDYPEGRKELELLADSGIPLQVYQMARRFGEANALSIGFEKAKADFVLTLPAYRQVDTEQLPALLAAIEGCDVVAARRWPRRDSRLNQWMTRIFHSLIRWITRYDFRDLGCGVRLFRRQVVEEVRVYGDQHRFLPVLAAHRGFNVREKSIDQSSHESRLRLYGPAVYLRRLLDIITVFFLTRFTKKPLRFFGIVGGSLLVLGSIALAVVVMQRLFMGVDLGDRPALVIATLMIVLGAQLVALGLVGELVIFSHAQIDKEYTVAERINISES